jgi:hypothetical protein
MDHDTPAKSDLQTVVDAIERLGERDLLFISRLAINRAKEMHERRRDCLMATFAKGDRVVFENREGQILEGVVLRINTKTVSVLTDEDGRWKVGPSLLRPVPSGDEEPRLL